jgi:hypothetical protein
MAEEPAHEPESEPLVVAGKRAHIWTLDWGVVHLRISSYLAVLIAEWTLTIVVLVGSAIVVIKPTNDSINSAAVAIVGTVVGYWFGSRSRDT